MADETILIDIEYNTGDSEKELDTLTSSIEGLKVEQAKLNDQLKEGEISQTEYSKQSAKVSTQIQAETKQRKDLTKIMQAENGSREKMRLSINKLTKERDQLNTSTEEGAKKSKELKKRIDEMNDALKDSGTELQAQRQNIGNYNDGLEGTKKGAGAFIGGIKGMIKASLAFIATPLGAIIAAIVVVFKLFKEALNRSEGSMNKVRLIAGKLGGIFSLLMKALEPLVDFILDSVIATFDALGNAVDKTMGFVSRALAKLGFDEAAAKVEAFTEKVKASTKAGEDLAKAQNKLNEAMRWAQKTQLDFQKLAERQRQIRDDEAKSIDERIAANIKLGQVLKDQMNTELALANQALKVAEMRIALEGKGKTTLDARAEALTNIADIQERVEAQTSEQLVNTNSLIREQTALRKKAADDLEASKNKAFMSDAEMLAFEDELQYEADKESKALELEIETEHSEKMNELFAKNEEDKTAIQAKEDAKRAAIKAALIQGAAQLSSQVFGLIEQSNQKRLNNELDAINKKEDAALKKAGDNEAKKEEIQKQFDKKREKAEKDAAKKRKRMAIIEAIIGGALAIISALQNAFPLNLIMAALTAVTTGIQIATIKNAPLAKGGKVPLAKRGANFGTFQGNSHASGGIDLFTGSGEHVANVEGKENFYVVNKQASAYINSLSDINQRIGGGVPLSQGSNRMAEGGRAEINTEQSGIDINEITNQVISNMPPIVVQTVDIKTGLEERNDVVSASVI